MTSHQLAIDIVEWIGLPELFSSDGPDPSIVSHIEDMIFDFVSEEIAMEIREADERMS